MMTPDAWFLSVGWVVITLIAAASLIGALTLVCWAALVFADQFHEFREARRERRARKEGAL